MSWFDPVLADLRSALARLSAIDLWPPWDAAQALAGVASEAWRVAAEPPLPDPGAVAAAAQEWRLVGAATARAGDDLTAVRSAVGTDEWSGGSGDAFRGSLGVLTRRLATVPVAVDDVTTGLTLLEAAMTVARARHQRGRDRLRPHLSLTWSDANPLALKDRLVGILEDLLAGIVDLVGAYEDAEEAVARARRTIGEAMDRVELPHHLPRGGHPSAIDIVNGWDDRHGPLAGPGGRSVLDRYDDAWSDLSPADQRTVTEALDGARTTQETGWIVAGVAGGLTGAALRRYVERLRSMGPRAISSLDSSRLREATREGTGGGRPLTQPDHTTCGSASLVVSHMLNDPAYNMWVLTGYDPRTDTGGLDLDGVEQRFHDESWAMHDRTNSLHDAGGGLQVPWPEGLGTQPWAVANQMSSGSGVPGADYGVTLVDPHDRASTFDSVVSASDHGHAVPLFVGNTVSPRHVMLATDSAAGVLTVYDPGTGHDITVTREEWTEGRLPFVWSEPWAVVVPSS